MPKKLHAQIQESAMGVQTSLIEKNSDKVFLSSSPAVEIQWFILRKTIIFQGLRGGPTFSGGGGGVKMVISIETY